MFWKNRSEGSRVESKLSKEVILAKMDFSLSLSMSGFKVEMLHQSWFKFNTKELAFSPLGSISH